MKEKLEQIRSSNSDPRELVALACAVAQLVVHLNHDPHARAAIGAARAWLDYPREAGAATRWLETKVEEMVVFNDSLAKLAWDIATSALAAQTIETIRAVRRTTKAARMETAWLAASEVFVSSIETVKIRVTRALEEIVSIAEAKDDPELLAKIEGVVDEFLKGKTK